MELKLEAQKEKRLREKEEKAEKDRQYKEYLRQIKKEKYAHEKINQQYE
jgi:hypothetical protein